MLSRSPSEMFDSTSELVLSAATVFVQSAYSFNGEGSGDFSGDSSDSSSVRLSSSLSGLLREGTGTARFGIVDTGSFLCARAAISDRNGSGRPSCTSAGGGPVGK